MVEYQGALAALRETAQARALKTEKISLMEAVGRICAEALTSPSQVPPFANSSMDGFALQAAATIGASPNHLLRISVLGSVAAGDTPPLNPKQNGAWEIMTGAPFPAGFDATVKIEDVRIISRDEKNQAVEIEISAPLEAKQNWRGPGADFALGAPVIKAGRMLTPEHVLALASLGISQVIVFKRPKIGLISTGRELVPMEESLAPGQIHNSTAPYLLTALRALGAEVSHLGTVPDDTHAFTALVQKSLTQDFDLLLTTGAVSMGKFDFVTESLAALGAKIFFHKVAIRPGKPLLFGEFTNGPVFFGLPGNPVSSVVTLRFFIDPYLRALQGMKPERPIRARLANAVSKPEGLRCFFKSQLSVNEQGARASILPGQASFMVSPLLHSTAWAILPEKSSALQEGDWVDVFPMHFSPYDWLESHATHSPTPGGCC